MRRDTGNSGDEKAYFTGPLEQLIADVLAELAVAFELRLVKVLIECRLIGGSRGVWRDSS